MSELNELDSNNIENNAAETTANKVAAYKFLQNEIARYLGNDGYLLKDEKEQLKALCGILKISHEDYERLLSMALSELTNFRVDAVLGYVLGRVNHSKLYSDAEKVFIRSSLADRWVEQLKGYATPNGKKGNTDEAKLECGIKIAEWLGYDAKEFTEWFNEHYGKKSKTGKIVNPAEQEIECDDPDEKKALEDAKKRTLDVFKDIDDLLTKQGFVEKKEHIDATKHPAALGIYIGAMVLATCGLYRCQFYEINNIHQDVSKYITFTDLRDNHQYNTITIGNIQWFAENLNYKTPNSVAAGIKAEGGQLYTWDEANEACPEGWRIPTDVEWKSLITIAGGDSIAARNLKSHSIWQEGLPATDSLNFSALPAGYRINLKRQSYSGEGKVAHWWSYTMLNSKEASNVQIKANSDSVEFSAMKIGNALSVRCVKVDGNTVPVRKAPRSNPPYFNQTIKGDVDGFKDQTRIPIIKLAPNKKEAMYSQELYSNLIGSNNSFGIIANPALNAKLIETGKKPLFLQNSNVLIKRTFERTYIKKNDSWVKDSVWLNDSVTVSGKYAFANMESLAENICGVTIRANLGVDTTASIVLNKPCNLYNVGNTYQIESQFVLQINRRCADDKCNTETSNMSYNIVNTDAYKLNNDEE